MVCVFRSSFIATAEFLTAAIATGLVCKPARWLRPETFDGSDDEAVEHVVSLNLHRRHLNESQRAVIAAKMANLGHGGDRRSSDFKSPKGGLNSADAAKRLNVSDRIVQRARRIIKDGNAEAVRAIEKGETTVGAVAAARKNRVIQSEEADLIEAMDNGDISPTAAYEELQERIRNIPQVRVNKPRKLIPIEDFVREMIRRISSVVRTGKLDAIVESSDDLTTYQKRDTAMALRRMGQSMIEKANELWPEEATTLDGQEYESEA